MNTNASNKQCPKCGAVVPAEAAQGLCPKCVLAAVAGPTEIASSPGPEGEPPSLERVAAAFPQFEIVELIGHGGMGSVFKARQKHLDRYVALKLLSDKLARDPQFAERFNREGRVLARLNHQNVVSVYDFGESGGFYYLIMEFVDGVNLREAMRTGKFSSAEALAIVPKICEALQFAHEEGILHRDIKPENILLDSKGRVKIADFGIAKLVGDNKPDVTLTATGATLGTPHYMAPEQLEKPSEVDHRADIYSLGVVFYEMLTGELPIGRFAPPSAKATLDVRVDEIVLRALARERELRQQSASEVKTQVEDIGKAKPPVTATAGNVGGSSTREPGSSVSNEPVIPLWSRKAIWSASLVALSLPIPLLLIAAISLRSAGIGAGELLLTLTFSGFPALAGTILGWIALSDLRTSQGRLRGLPLAAFGALTWPLLVLLLLLLVPSYLILVPSNGTNSIRPVWFSFLLPIALLSLAVWMVRVVIRWASGEALPRLRRSWAWLAGTVVVCLMGITLVNFLADSMRPVRQPAKQDFSPGLEMPAPVKSEAEPVADATSATAPWLRMTFTAVELRQETGTNWLAMDWVEDVHGKCQHTFRTVENGSDLNAVTRKTSFLKQEKDSPEVRHQRTEWRLPAAVEQADALAFRDQVAEQWLRKSLVVRPGDERILFTLRGPGPRYDHSLGRRQFSRPGTVSADQSTSPFAPTRWTLVQRARGETPEAQKALGELCEAYWMPVFRFLRREGRDDEAARELTQEFFARLLGRRGLDTVEPGRGKFRSFLLGAVKHFLADMRDHDRRLKRGGGVTPEPLEYTHDTAPALNLPDLSAVTPDSFFDRQWALTLMERALQSVEKEFLESDKREQFEVLKPWLVGETPALSQAEAARQLNLREGAVKVAIHRLRKRFRELIRAEIAQTIGEPEKIDEELRYLVEVLSAA